MRRFPKNWRGDLNVLLIHSVRPERLPIQILAFVENRGTTHTLPSPLHRRLVAGRSALRRGTLFVVVADIRDDPAYAAALAATEDRVAAHPDRGDIWIDYWPLDRQLSYFRQLLRGVPNGASLYSLLRDHGAQEMRGLRGVQNRSVLVADHVTRHVQGAVIYHRVDDDMVPHLALMDSEGVVRIDHCYDLLGHKAARLDDASVTVLGSKYSIDSASPLEDLIDGMWTLGRFLDGLETGEQAFPASIVDRSGLVVESRSPAITGDWMRSPPWPRFLELQRLLEAGVNRLSRQMLNDFDAAFCDARETIPGGFVSFRKESTIVPVPPAGHQDVLFSVLQHGLHGGVHGDLPVGHCKALRYRRPLLASMTARSPGLGNRTDPQVTAHFLSVAAEAGIRVGHDLPRPASYAGWRHHRLVENLAPVLQSAMSSLASRRSGASEQERAARRSWSSFGERVRAQLGSIEAGYTYEWTERVAPDDPVRSMFDNWLRCVDGFHELRQQAGRDLTAATRTPQGPA